MSIGTGIAVAGIAFALAFVVSIVLLRRSLERLEGP